MQELWLLWFLWWIVNCDSGKRPFGVSILYIGWDKHHGFQLYQSDPSGNYGGWKATCIGNNSAVSFTSFTVLHLTDNFTVKTSHDMNLFDLAWICNSTHVLCFKNQPLLSSITSGLARSPKSDLWSIFYRSDALLSFSRCVRLVKGTQSTEDVIHWALSFLIHIWLLREISK